jgi:hypothetical protein
MMVNNTTAEITAGLCLINACQMRYDSETYFGAISTIGVNSGCLDVMVIHQFLDLKGSVTVSNLKSTFHHALAGFAKNGCQI